MSKSLEPQLINKFWKRLSAVEEIINKVASVTNFIIKLTVEIQWRRQHWADTSTDFPNLVSETLLKFDEEILPFMNILLTTVCTRPVSVASAEMNFSSLGRIQIWMRCRMSEVRLSYLVVIRAHKK